MSGCGAALASLAELALRGKSGYAKEDPITVPLCLEALKDTNPEYQTPDHPLRAYYILASCYGRGKCGVMAEPTTSLRYLAKAVNSPGE